MESFSELRIDDKCEGSEDECVVRLYREILSIIISEKEEKYYDRYDLDYGKCEDDTIIHPPEEDKEEK